MMLLEQLVKIKSYSGNESDISQFIGSWLAKSGVKITWQDGNVIAHINGDNNNKALIFNGHMDTVNPGQIGKWKSNPFVLTQSGHKLFGLGTSDMKGGIASMMLLGQKLAISSPPCDIWLAFVTKEEVDGSGSDKFVKWFTQNNKYDEVSAVICDTTGISNIEIGHKGNAFVKVIFHGDSGHGSRPDLINKQAVLNASKFINSINKFADKLISKYTDKYLGMPSVAVTGINSGDLSCPNKIPGECAVLLDIRTTPKLHDHLKMELNKLNVTFEYISKPASFGWCNPNERIVKSLMKANTTSKITYSNGSTDQCFFTQSKIPAVIFGLGNKGVVHQENEWIADDDIDAFVNLYFKIINLCGNKL